MKIVLVQWVDSQAVHGWNNVKKDFSEADLMCVSAGFLTHESDVHLTISASLDSLDEAEFDANNTMIIPKCAVRSIETLRGE